MVFPSKVYANSNIKIDGTLDTGEWDSYHWFTDNSAGPGTGYDDDPLPIFSGYITHDSENIYLAFNVEDNTPNTNRDFLYVTFDIPLVGVFNKSVDALYWGSTPTSASFFGEAYLTANDFPWDRSQRVSTWGTDKGVLTARTITDTHRYYEMKIPLAAIGATTGDTIGLKIQARAGQYTSATDPQVVNYYPDMPDGITPIRSDTRVEVAGNFYHYTLSSPPILVTSITVTGAGGATTVANGGTLAMSAEVLPADATDPSVTWSVAAGTGAATIDATTGVLTATGVGTVTVTATTNDGSGVTGTLEITVTTPPPTTPTAPTAPNYVQQTVGAGTVTVDASSVAGAYATVTGSGGQTVTIKGISSAAASAGGFSIEGATTYVDLHLDNSEGVEQIQFTILGGAGVPMWWNGSSWIECSNYAIDAAGNVTVTITGSTIPSLSDLTGTVFTVVGKPAITVLGITETIPVEIETVRTNPLTCWQIYVNEEGNFEFIFWWEYANNNWVSIYDTQGNLVYLEDFPYGNPVVEVDLTSGMYTVKTFHEAGKILQEFAIGKP